MAGEGSRGPTEQVDSFVFDKLLFNNMCAVLIMCQALLSTSHARSVNSYNSLMLSCDFTIPIFEGESNLGKNTQLEVVISGDQVWTRSV